VLCCLLLTFEQGECGATGRRETRRERAQTCVRTVDIGGSGSSVGIATDYGLDGPGSNPGRDEIFRPSKPTLGPTQPPVKWVTGLSRG